MSRLSCRSEEDDRDPIERAIDWANKRLEPNGECVTDFLKDFTDGIKIGHIIENITQQDLTMSQQQNQTVFQKRHAIQISLRYLINYRIISKNLVRRDDILWGELVPTYNLLRIINVRLDNGDLPPLPPHFKYEKRDRNQPRKPKAPESEPEEPKKSKYAVGIDIGTCYCRYSVYKGNSEEHDDQEEENNAIPTQVVFQGESRFVGEVSTDVLDDDDAIVINDIKRIIGRDFTDPDLIQVCSNLPYKVEQDPASQRPFVTIPSDNPENKEGEKYSFEHLMSLLLFKVKRTVSDEFNEDVIDAVISVPALFPNSQRQAIKDAARIAGFNVIRIVSDTAASAMALNTIGNTRSEEKKHFVVFDMGGGKVDASLVSLEGGICTTLNSAGDLSLGGRDLDSRLAQYYEENLADDEEKENLKRNGEKSKLLRESEQTKIELSKNDVAYLRGKEIKREDFEKWCQDLLERAIEPVKKIFEEGNRIIDPDQVKRVVLAGGSSKIPKIREQLQEFFGPDVELYDIDEGCSVSVGAAMQGAIMKGEIKTDELEGAELKDTLPLSLGISQANGVNSIIIPHGTVLPAKYTTMATTSVDGQTNVAFDIVQGERKMAKDCIKLGHVTVHGIQVAKRCVPKIEVVMEIDESGFLAVHATDLATGATMTTSVYSQSNLSENDIQSLLDDAERNQAEDDLKCLVASEKAELSYSINKFDRILKENPLAQSQNNEARKKIDAARNWLKQNEESNDVETITAKRVELEQLFDKIYPE